MKRHHHRVCATADTYRSLFFFFTPEVVAVQLHPCISSLSSGSVSEYSQRDVFKTLVMVIHFFQCQTPCPTSPGVVLIIVYQTLSCHIAASNQSSDGKSTDKLFIMKDRLRSVMLYLKMANGCLTKKTHTKINMPL